MYHAVQSESDDDDENDDQQSQERCEHSDVEPDDDRSVCDADACSINGKCQKYQVYFFYKVQTVNPTLDVLLSCLFFIIQKYWIIFLK